jgi:hypothetical protein
MTEKLKQLYSTGVPEPFDVLFACDVKNHSKVEKALHNILRSHRPNPSREFFNVPSEIVTPILQLLSIEDKTEKIQADLDKEFNASTQPASATQSVGSEVSTETAIPPGYKKYQDLKSDFKENYPLVFEDDTLLSYRISVRHRIDNVKYYKFNKLAYYNPETFKKQLEIEERNKQKDLAKSQAETTE